MVSFRPSALAVISRNHHSFEKNIDIFRKTSEGEKNFFFFSFLSSFRRAFASRCVLVAERKTHQKRKSPTVMTLKSEKCLFGLQESSRAKKFNQNLMVEAWKSTFRVVVVTLLWCWFHFNFFFCENFSRLALVLRFEPELVTLPHFSLLFHCSPFSARFSDDTLCTHVRWVCEWF